ncbi:ISSfl4 ORF3 [Escherichia coli B7A]|nr:IS1203 transposase orfA [Escherichia coli B7A]ENB92205.1 transposase IS66 family protein [Escherichia coli P0299438.3]ENC25788.1 transposase IS66 family protein [Escherichia coli P0299438.7]ENC32852.1 transposase IS66 family protein [Escherichia coli P0299438.8]WNT76464.1 hypothetical protein QMY48_04976 [Escherichia coli]
MELQDWRKEPRKNYSNEFKLRMVELASQPGACVAQIEALKLIGELYAIEHEIRGLPVSERLAVRQMQSKPLLTSLYKLMQEKEHTLSKKCRLRDAFRYIRKHWVALCNFCDDGLAEADNNTAERALRAVCLGKKNYVFFGSDHGGERGALLYGLIEPPRKSWRLNSLRKR